MVRQKKIDIILYSQVLKRKIQERLKELSLRPNDVVKIAKEEGMTTISKEKLSRYFNSNIPIHGYPTQADILWLATRFSIDFKLKIKAEEYVEKQAKINAKVILDSMVP